MRFTPHWLVVVASLGTAFAAQAAGRVELSFDKPAEFTDAGDGTFERERNLKALREHVERYASRLPDGQTLQLTFLDVDLAGRVWPGSIPDLRVLNGRADWPRIKLRYTLSSGGQTLKSGEETLSDMGYLFGLHATRSGDPLPYDSRMLDRWLVERILK